MNRTFVRALCAATSLMLLFQVGCGGGSSGSAKMEAPELGFSARVPDGWKIDRQNPRMCWKGDSTGLVLEESLEGKVFVEHVAQLCKADNGRILSKTSATISGRAAIQAVIEYPNAGSTALKAYIHKDDKLIEISFVTPTSEFAGQESALRAAIQSIELK